MARRIANEYVYGKKGNKGIPVKIKTAYFCIVIMLLSGLKELTW